MRLGIKYEGSHVELWADESFWTASVTEINQVTGGCGPGWFGDYLVPDTVWGLSIKRACRIHDWDYYIGTDKKLADLRFLLNMARIVKTTKWKWLRNLRLKRIDKYYRAVVRFGDAAYNTA